MENYNSEPTVTHEIEPEPFDPAIKRLHIEKQGIRHYVSECTKILKPEQPVVLVAGGKFSPKAVGCAEILKAKKMHVAIHQINQVTFVRTIETYEPLLEGLDALRVIRSMPLLHILLSMEPLDEKSKGYQKTTGDGRKYGKKTVTCTSLQEND